MKNPAANTVLTTIAEQTCCKCNSSAFMQQERGYGQQPTTSRLQQCCSNTKCNRKSEDNVRVSRMTSKVSKTNWSNEGQLRLQTTHIAPQLAWAVENNGSAHISVNISVPILGANILSYTHPETHLQTDTSTHRLQMSSLGLGHTYKTF